MRGGQPAVNLKPSHGAPSNALCGWTGLGGVPKHRLSSGTSDLLGEGTSLLLQLT